MATRSAPRARRTLRRGSVLMLASEAVPYAKTGGLADVAGALPPALARLGWDVTVALPRYRGVSAGSRVARTSVTVGGVRTDVAIFEDAMPDGVRVWLVDAPTLFDRERLYGIGNDDYPDNARRFAVLVRAALERAATGTRRPDLVHVHDWQTALAPVYLKTRYRDGPRLGTLPSVLTIHNLAYQGLFEADWLPRLDLPWDLLGIDRMEYWGRISLLKGGINDADALTTVSPRYAQEIQTPEHGSGFDGILRRRSHVLTGILNGIDTSVWDPARDPFLPAPYSSSRLGGKHKAKAAVLERYGLPTDARTLDRPLIGMISRMVDQKGFDLIAALADEIPRLDASIVVLGTGEARYQELWRSLASTCPDRIGAFIGFDEERAHLIEGGADMFLMPSRFEPCGLNQMYSLRYGTVPVVRAVGGLADTVREAPEGPEKPANGFVFVDYTPEALRGALMRSLAAFQDRSRWRHLQTAGMQLDHSWDRSAREYVTIYERLMRNARSVQPGRKTRTTQAKEH